MTLPAYVSLLGFSLLAGYYHLKDFVEDPAFYGRGLGWFLHQPPVVTYCTAHAVLAVIFYFLAFPFFVGQLQQTADVKQLLDAYPTLSYPLLSSTLFIVVIRARLKKLQIKGWSFSLGLRILSEGLISLLGPWAHERRASQELAVARYGCELLADRLPRVSQRVEVVRATRATLASRLDDKQRERLELKWITIEEHVERGGTEAAMRQYVTQAVYILALWIHRRREMKQYFEAAMQNVLREVGG